MPTAIQKAKNKRAASAAWTRPPHIPKPKQNANRPTFRPSKGSRFFDCLLLPVLARQHRGQTHRASRSFERCHHFFRQPCRLFKLVSRGNQKRIIASSANFPNFRLFLKRQLGLFWLSCRQRLCVILCRSCFSLNYRFIQCVKNSVMDHVRRGLNPPEDSLPRIAGQISVGRLRHERANRFDMAVVDELTDV